MARHMKTGGLVLPAADPGAQGQAGARSMKAAMWPGRIMTGRECPARAMSQSRPLGSWTV
jgi:hypothetical protein